MNELGFHTLILHCAGSLIVVSIHKLSTTNDDLDIYMVSSD
jgi:hypothetical protein